MGVGSGFQADDRGADRMCFRFFGFSSGVRRDLVFRNICTFR